MSFGIDNIQLLRAGERIGGKSKAKDDFDDVDLPEGGGAEDLFD